MDVQTAALIPTALLSTALLVNMSAGGFSNLKELNIRSSILGKLTMCDVMQKLLYLSILFICLYFSIEY